MTTPERRNSEPDPPFLETDPPHWVARSLSTVILALFVVGILVATLVKVPETVAGAFVLVPEHGADPVRAAREGTVTDVRTTEGQSVERGATLFVIRSQAIGDRNAEMATLDMQRTGAEQRRTNARTEYASQRRADDLEGRRLEAKLGSLERSSTLRRQQLVNAREVAERSKRGVQQGVVVGFEADRLVLEADRLASEVETTAAELEDTRGLLAKLRQDTTTRAVQHRELVRSLEQERRTADARLESMRGQFNGDGGDLVITSPCAGTVLRLIVSTTGAVVQAGEALGEVACAGQRLQLEMTLGQQAVARIRVGQNAKLLYDAFPYQRFGVRFGSVRWVGPVTVGPARTTAGAAEPQPFRALIDPADSAIIVRGESRPLLVGMRGRARVVTGERTLISFAFEPIRALRENFSSTPSASPRPAT